MTPGIALPLLCTLSACITVDPQDRVQALEFACGDLAVIGRIATVGSEASHASDALPNWRNEYRLQVRIKRVVRGKEHRRVVPARATAHAQIRNDKDPFAVLHPDGDGGYSLVTADLSARRPKLAGACP